MKKESQRYESLEETEELEKELNLLFEETLRLEGELNSVIINKK